MGDQYEWRGNSGSFSDAKNWDDFTTDQSPAHSPPGGSDFADLHTDNGAATVSGDGNVGTLQIEDNITVTGAITADTVSFLFSSSAIATVSGGTLNGTSELDLDSGSLTVAKGGELDAGAMLDFGTISLNSGTISATELGIGGTLTLAQAMVSATDVSIGANPGVQSTLDIASGSTVTDSAGVVGLLSGDQSSVGVSGAWTNSTELTIGSGATATLDITAGGSVSAGGGSGTGLAVGSAASAGGVITVDGASSVLDVSGDADFGGTAGSAQVTLTNGASLDVSGTLNAGTADIDVNGGTLTIGQGMTMSEIASTLEIEGGGTVSGPGGATMTIDGTIDINDGRFSGTTLESGNSITVQNGTISINNVLLGTGTGGVPTFTSVEADGKLNAGIAELGPLADDRSTVAVFSGGTLQTGIQLLVGNGGTGALDIEGGLATINGGVDEGNPALDAGVLNAAAVGTIALDGAGSSLTVTGAADLGDAGAGSMLIGTGAAFTVAAGLYEGVQSSSGGSLQVIASSDTFSVGGDWVIGDAGGHVDTISGGASASVGGALTIARGGGSSSLTITGSGSQANVAGDVTVGQSGSGTLQVEAGASLTAGGAFSVTSGSADISGGAQVAATSVTIGSAGSLSLSGGTLSVGDMMVAGSVSGSGSIASAATVDGTISANGSLVVQGLVSGTGVLSIQSGTLELQAGVAAGPTIDFDAGTLLLDTPGAADATFANFGAGDTIVLHGVVANSGSFSNGTLLVQEDGATQAALAFEGAYGSDNFSVTSVGNETSITYVACFGAGTRIATPGGPVAVESLRVGDRVLTAGGRSEPVVWLGHRRLDCRRHNRPHNVSPVRIRAGAFGQGRPGTDLWLSPDHAVHVGGALIPIRYLINGATIVQEAGGEVTYWHVELPAHDVILAENLPCESFLDTGNRGAFADNGAALHLHPDFALQVWDAQACAPLVRDGAELAAARRACLSCARNLGWELTGDADLHLLAGGEVVRPVAIDGARHRFALPRGVGPVRIRSRSGVPAHVDPDGTDHRRLGVMISRMAAFRPWQWQEVSLAGLPGGPGFHALEEAAGRGWRWTDGDAALPLPPECSRDGVLLLDLDIEAAQPAWRAPDAPEITAPNHRRPASGSVFAAHNS